MDILQNSTFVVGISFVLFIALVVYLKVPGMITRALDARAEKIKAELAEARQLREEAQTLLASFERKHKEVEGLAQEIVDRAKADAAQAAADAEENLKLSIARRLKAAEDQIASAEASAVREVRDSAINVATEAARDIIAGNMSKASSDDLIKAAIDEVGAKLH